MATENIEIEYGIFYAIFTKQGKVAIRKLLDKGLCGENFGSLFHRQIYDEIVKIYRDSGSLMSLKLFAKHFCSRPGSSTEDKIKIENFVEGVRRSKITLEDLDHSLKIVIECYATRKFLSSLNEMLDCMDTKPLTEIVPLMQESYKKTLSLLDQENQIRVMGLKGGFEDRLERANEVRKNPDEAGMVKTGLKNIDKFIGRQSPGQFVLYQARTGVGKSMMLMGSAIANFQSGLKVMVITIEMSEYDYLYRFDSNLTGIEHREFANGEITADDDKVKIWKNRIKSIGGDSSDLMVYWVPSGCTPDKVEDLIASNPFKPDLVVVDYAGDMKAGIRGVPDYDARSHGAIYSSLKELAGKYNCVIYSAQQSKRGTAGKADTESGAWSDVASAKSDIIFAVEVTKEDQDFITEVEGNVVIGRMTVSVIKGRNVPKCKTHIIPRFQKMSWLEKESEEMIGCGAGKEVKNPAKAWENKAKNQEEDLVEEITGKETHEEADLFAEQ